MIFNVITLLMVLGVTFLQSIFGFFSGLINLFCVMISVAVAFGFYESLNLWATEATGLAPGYVEPCCLVGLFLITLTALRTAADNLIRGNVHVPQWMDWSGATICGFINAQLTIGTLAIGVAMLPIGGAPMGFERYSRTGSTSDNKISERFERNSIWTRSDDMTVGFVNLLSSGSMKAATPLSAVYPNFTDAVFYSTNTVQAESTPSPFRDKKGGDGFMQGLRIESWWYQKQPLIEPRYRKGVPNEKDRQPRMESAPKFERQPGNDLIGMRLILDKSAAERAGGTAHVFRTTMIRLVGTVDKKPAQFTPSVIGGADEFIGGANRVVDLDNNFRIGEPDAKIDAYFEVPEGFSPWFVEYRRHARAEIVGEPAKSPPSVALKLITAEEKERIASASGRQSFGTVIMGDSTDNRNLPFELATAKLRSMPDVAIEGETLVRGRLSGTTTQFAPGPTDPRIKELKIPAGYRILQIKYKPKEVRSVVGSVFNYVGGVVNQYIAVDDRGEKHMLHGYYAIVQRGNDRRFELFFNGPPDDLLDGSYHHMLDFKDIEKSELNDADNAEIGLIFLVRPGTRIQRIQNQAGDGGDVSIPMSP
jgi:hypothetical protein